MRSRYDRAELRSGHVRYVTREYQPTFPYKLKFNPVTYETENVQTKILKNIDVAVQNANNILNHSKQSSTIGIVFYFRAEKPHKCRPFCIARRLAPGFPYGRGRFAPLTPEHIQFCQSQGLDTRVNLGTQGVIGSVKGTSYFPFVPSHNTLHASIHARIQTSLGTGY